MSEAETCGADGCRLRRFLPLVLVLFVGSGCAALIYEVVWFQLLELVIGASGVSLGILLGVFMGGMCAGSLSLARAVSPLRHPLQVYGVLELCIGLLGLAALVVVPWAARLYVHFTGPGFAGLFVRSVFAAVCLVPPTVLMGATLPAVSRAVRGSREGISWLGWFYGGNILGAVCGSVLAGFYLLRVYDMRVATWTAAGINFAVCLMAFGVARVSPYRAVEEGEEERERDQEQEPRAKHPYSVYGAIGISGFTALSAEVIWTRHLSLMLGPTVYTFSIILAVFLVGLGIGSGAGAALSRAKVCPGRALGVCQLLLVPAMAWAAYMLCVSLPYWPINPSLAKTPWLNFQVDILRCAWAILPATVLWGASFPLALAAALPQEREPGRLVGGVYAANTAGAIAGAVSCSVLLISWLGTQEVHRLLMVLACISSAIMLIPQLKILSDIRQERERASRRGQEGSSKEKCRSESGAAAHTLQNLTEQRRGVVTTRVAEAFAGLSPGSVLLWVAGVAIGIGLVRTVPRVPWQLVAHGRYLPTKTEVGTALYMGEGMNATVAVTELNTGVRMFHVSGKVEASTDGRDMRLQRMLGHIPALVHPQPRSILVVGCGAGVTAGSFLLHPDVEKITVCEIEPLIPRVVAQFFGNENYDLVRDPRVRIVYDDARHFILTTHERFDIITSDPIHPWVKGAATLYTKEYFELCKEHLNPGGLITQWVPLYESNLAVVKSEVATFFSAFPNGTLWSNDDEGGGYDLVLMGSLRTATTYERPPFADGRIDLDQLQRRMTSVEYTDVAKSLRDVGCRSAFSLLATYAGRASDLGPWLKGAQINRDLNLRLQYLAGMGSYFYETDLILTDLLIYRHFPDELFAGSQAQKDAVRLLIDRTKTPK